MQLRIRVSVPFFCSVRFIIDAKVWRGSLPHSIAAIFYVDDTSRSTAEKVAFNFWSKYNLSEDSYPRLHLSEADWEAPFTFA